MKRKTKQSTGAAFVRNKFQFQVPALPPKTPNQKLFVQSLQKDTICVAHGPAGTGKTLLALHHASKSLLEGRFKRIILIRPYQPLAGRSIGFLPGELEDKLIPYYAQMLSYLEDFLTKPRVEIAMKDKTIEICSLETIRGRSWDYSIIVVDEAQGLFPQEVQALTTRVGVGSQLILLGDNSGVQTDIKNKTDGLSYLLGVIEKYNISAGVTKLTYDDILRSDITKEFVIAYDKELHQATKK